MTNVTDGSVVWAIKTIKNAIQKNGDFLGDSPNFRLTGTAGRLLISAAPTIDAASGNGGRLILYGKDSADNPNGFRLGAMNGNGGEAALVGKSDKSLLWNGMNVLTQAYYSTSGHSNHSCVLKLGNVLIMAGQVQVSSAATSHTIKFPQTFLNSNTYGVTVTPYAGDGASRKCTITNQGKDFALVAVDTAVSWLFYVAIGQYK